ncbi:MAG: hypothetical protein K2W80_01880 [Burkholderiales bacterium]|nr:hypothetical protein [Burkholderiales bacterium]
MPDFAEIDRMYNLRAAPQPVDDEPADLVMAREANMRRLLALLPTDDSASNPMQAELLRQLGEFDLALAVLSRPLPNELETARKKLQALCEAQDRTLGVLN